MKKIKKGGLTTRRKIVKPKDDDLMGKPVIQTLTEQNDVPEVNRNDVNAIAVFIKEQALKEEQPKGTSKKVQTAFETKVNAYTFNDFISFVKEKRQKAWSSVAYTSMAISAVRVFLMKKGQPAGI